jgi:pimeloyl-ACP methyl ester carboxylesterase
VIHVPYVTSYLDTPIYFETYGKKTAKALVLVTGLASNMLQWQPSLIDELSQRYYVILIDNRGCGRSGSSWKFYSMKTYSRDIRNILNFLGIEKANILGHSLGGSICQRFAITYPKRIENIVLISPDIGAFKRKLPSRKIIGMLICGLKTDAQLLLKNAFCIHDQPLKKGSEIRSALDTIEKVFRYYPISKRDYRKQLYAALFFNTLKKVEDIRNKTLILAGDHDKIVLPGNAIRLASRLPNASVSLIPNCGHLFLFDDLKPILTDLYDFLQ